MGIASTNPPEERVNGEHEGALQAAALLRRQKTSWRLLAENFRALERVETKQFRLPGGDVRVQFNPARIASTAAKVDAGSVAGRRCFLCPAHLPEEQERVEILPGYWLLCNPYPIFREHFTLPFRQHADQRIAGYFGDFLKLSRLLSGYVLFYNGPCCGASAPDHLHFQAASLNEMPMDGELARRLSAGLPEICRSGEAVLSLWAEGWRNAFVLSSPEQEAAERLFALLYNVLPREEPEPKMNLFAYFDGGRWTVVVVPRRAHRPACYYETGGERFLASPGAADMGGLFITARREDFERATEERLWDIYAQVSRSKEELERIASQI